MQGSDKRVPATIDPRLGSAHKASVMAKAPAFKNEFGSITRMDSGDLAVLQRMSLRRLVLSPRGVREPHWHANANELGYCLRGSHLVTIAGSHSAYDSFTIGAGQMFFVPSGALHHIENVGADEGEIILAFSSERVEDFGLSGVFGCFTDAVLGNTTGLPAAAFAGLKRSPADTNIGGRAAAAVADAEELHINRYKYDLERALPQIDLAAGSAHTTGAAVWPALDKLSMFSVRITDQGMRELHWHPETAEMGYVTGGRGRMTIVSPGGVTDTYEMQAGDMYFIPRAYPHHIENIGDELLSLLIFFDQSTAQDIGGKSLVSMFSPEVMAATFKTDVAAVPKFPFTAEDPLIVPRLNPVD